MKSADMIIAVMLTAALISSVFLADMIFKKMNPDGRSIFSYILKDREEAKKESDSEEKLTETDIEVRKALRNSRNPSLPPPAPVTQKGAETQPQPQAAPKKEEKRLRDVRDIQVTLYVTSWCPHCRSARSYLNSQGVSFREYDIERDPGAAQEMRAKTGGGRGVPVVDVEGIIIRGYSPQAISNAINRKRKT
jgi:glutaredoxin-like YruB-family protein